MAKYIPRVIICGDVAKFRDTVGSAEIVGQVTFTKTGNEIQLLYGGQPLTGDNIRQLLDGTAEYLLFTDALQLNDYLEVFPPNTQVMSARAFAEKIRDGFFSNKTLAFLLDILDKNFSGRALDFDGFIAKSDFHTRGNRKVAIDCVAEGGLYPIMENVYEKIFRKPEEYRYRIFDAVILSRERTPEEFIDALIDTDALSKNILAFVRKNSALESWLTASENIFAAIKIFPVENGAWCLLKKISPPDDVGVYIVTHKDAKLAKLPPCYRIIHAGHALAKKNFGYIGDDTGDNISHLNIFLDEITALYWIWRNTRHSHVGLVHYRRFLTSKTNRERRPGEYVFSAKNILSEAEILKLLREYDIIVHTERMSNRTQRELMIFSTENPELVAFVEKIVRKHLARTQPDYLDAFDAVIGGFVFFLYGIHITRRNIFDAYCKWLFSFIIDATNETRKTVKIDGKPLEDAPHLYSRMMSFIAERMLTIWLMKNHLRIKPLPIMFRDDV